jgi:hypothetical protein
MYVGPDGTNILEPMMIQILKFAPYGEFCFFLSQD